MKKNMCFLVNIELGRAPKKMLIFFPKGKGGERGKGWGVKKKHAVYHLLGESDRCSKKISNILK